MVHRVTIPDPKSHLVHVETTVSAAGPLPQAVVLFMAVWTPGSYLVREYARHVESLAAAPPARATKIRKNAWRIDTGGASSVTVSYRVYAAELTVRTSHVDETHAFLVGAALFLGLEGRPDVESRVEIHAPAGWKLATSLPDASAPSGGDPRVHSLVAADYDALVDSPIELGTHREEAFDVLGKPHRYAIWPGGAVSDADARRLVADTKTILETEARLFGGALPYESYDLLLHLSPRSRGGLEHAAGAALIASPASFASREAYLDLLSLIGHEAFHAWNVKRIRPAGLAPYRYEEECYTRLLWWFEGATSYYDWRVLALAGLCTVDEYLDHLGSEIAYLDQTPGRLVHALEDASYDAWIKLYRPDESTPNTSVSYYRKGEIVCLLLDLEIRARSAGRSSLDRVLAHLWTEHGATGTPVPEDGMLAAFERATGVALGDRFDAWIRAPGEIDYEPVLASVGLTLERSSKGDAAPSSLGARLRAEGGRVTVTTVPRGSAAARAGIDAGDELLAVGGVRVEGTSLDATLRGRGKGEEVEVLVARDGRILQRRATLDGPRLDRVKVVAQRDAPEAARARFSAWLGKPHPAWPARAGGAP